MTSIKSKLIQFYGVGIPHGERPRSIRVPLITQDEPAQVVVSAGAGTVTRTKTASQVEVARVEVQGRPGAISVGNEVVQVQPAEVLVAAGVGAVAVGLKPTQQEPARVEVLAGTGLIIQGLGVFQADPAEVHVVGGLGDIVLSPKEIVGETAEVHVVAGVGAVTIKGEVTQVQPAEVHVIAGQAQYIGPTLIGGKVNIIQHTPADAIVIGQYGTTSTYMAQNQPSRVLVRAGGGIVVQEGIAIQSRQAVVRVFANSGSIKVTPNQTAPAEAIVVAGVASVAVGKTFSQALPARVEARAGSGTVVVGQAFSQNTPSRIEVLAGLGSITVDPAPPIVLVQVEPGLAEISAGLGIVYTGEVPDETWTGPHECLEPFATAHEIIRKTPSEVLWVGYTFQFEPWFKILNAVVDDGGAGIISSAVSIGGVNGEPNVLRYEISNGVDQENVKILHTIQLDDPENPFRYGNGFVYIRA